MKCIKYFAIVSCFFFSLSACATEYAPWFSPPLELQGRLTYSYERDRKVQTPLGSFQAHNEIHSLCGSIGATTWPNWNVELELLLTRADDISFSYEASLLTLRHAWFDDIAGDWISLVTGATLAFPGHRYLHNLSFFYHGDFNVELHAAVGKEWACCAEPLFRAWVLGGFGFANRGSPWLHTIEMVEWLPFPYLAAGLFSESLFGCGSHDINPTLPFRGYAFIDHRSVNLGGYLSYTLCYTGTLTFLGWYNLYARNTYQNNWGTQLNLLFPFSLL